ncbi:condensation domain-containing protein [Marinomonas transparens]|uniref:Peptide synthetase n=1 Tax=Marinomonas transparens TaxID=2795388 RepID=A0A934JSZ2_9GAMM|nr:condensation domain-containing protein [Marinomonas transparens]MBJ7539343.1 peptide synthetase [Marinomonas transparens]
MSELTSMQAACWFGRISDADFLGGVAAHLYAEFDGSSIDLNRLESALQRAYSEHAILRLNLSVEGVPHIAPSVQAPLLEIDDLTLLSNKEQQQHLLDKREQWTHQQLDLANGQTARFSVSQLNNGHFRLHVDADMIAVDPSSFCLLMEDLAVFYGDSEAIFDPAPAFFDWHNIARSDADLKKLRNRDRMWWKSRLPDIAPAPSLPLSNVTSKHAQSHRLSETLTSKEWHELQRLARSQKVTFSNLVLSLFAFTLSQATQDKRFRLNVPVFWREPLVVDTNRCIGDFANFVILNVNIEAANNLTSLCHDIASQMIDLLEHSHYAGVNIMRDLSRHHGAAQIAPVVFTAALDLPKNELFSEHVRQAFGSMNWTVSQGPQVALDAQAVRMNDGILINWDIRLDSLPLDWMSELFNRFMSRLKEVSKKPELLDVDFDKIQSSSFNKKPTKKAVLENTLSPMQQAYLLGRTAQLPLGGVAMQEFREYRGKMDPIVLRERLTAMVKRHESLRTYIDSNKLLQFVSDDIAINLKDIDLKNLTTQAASAYIESYRDTYTHALFDLDFSPWNITIFHLENDRLCVFARFDALILDGRSIASLMIELFDMEHAGQQSTMPNQPSSVSDQPTESEVETRKADMDYWQKKLSAITKEPQLPWSKPLHQLGISRYERKSLTVSSTSFRQCCKAGAKQGLFKNSVIMTLILELLAYWSNDKHIYVAVPVLPIYSGSFSNNSTFIPVEWHANVENLSQQANSLQVDILEGLQHLCFSGVDLARMLFEKCGSGPALPIVVTNGLSWPTLSDASPMTLENGLTQTPQVAIDIRFSTQQNGVLVFDVDYACDAIDASAIHTFLTAIEAAIDQITRSNLFSFDAAECFSIDSNQNQPGLNLQDYSNSPLFCGEQLLNIYLETINPSEDKPTSKDMDFISMGLRPHHVKTVLDRLYDTYSIRLSPAKIFQCRNIADVEKLLKTEQLVRQSSA